ncbi:MAG: hypothetical protein INR73_21515 [Williamsia sp.]|nr:hypothetical protein [Williamsia sp.]
MNRNFNREGQTKFMDTQHLFTRLGWLVLFTMSANLSAHAQINRSSMDGFEIISRTPMAEKANTLGVTAGNAPATFRMADKNGKVQYSIVSNGDGGISVDALSYIEYAQKANRYVVYGDSSRVHVVSKAYVNFYTGDGKLLKALGLIATWPFTAALSESGFFAIAGNKNPAGTAPSMALSLYDANGNKQWEASLPNEIPTRVFIAEDGMYTAVALFDSDKRTGSVRYYNNKGALVFTDREHSSASGIEFLPSGKAVLAVGNGWFLYDLSGGYKLLASGKLPGNTVGKYPVSAHPSRNLFLILTTSGSPTNTGYRLQAFDSNKGTLLADGSFEGEPSWQPFRLAEVAADGNIRLITSREVIQLKMK